MASRLAGATTCNSFFTVLTPSIPLVIPSAACFAASESTLPRIITVPCVVSTLISLPLTRESANSAILLFAVIHESLIGVFSSALLSACADPVMSAPPITKLCRVSGHSVYSLKSP